MKRHGFTLIELLVVIAIIAILAAILFPVFAQARESARTSSCLSNNKQLGTALLMYLQDYDERFPGWNWTFNCGGGNAGAPRDSGTFWTMAILPYVKNMKVYQCPNDLMMLNDQWAGCSDDGGAHDRFAVGADNYVSYGFNEYLTTTPKYSAVRQPAKEMMLADSATQLSPEGPLGWWNAKATSIAARIAFGNDTSWNIFTEKNAWNLGWTAQDFMANFSASDLDNATRHHGGNNITYCDGHSKYLRWQSTTVCNLSSDVVCP